jgi:magnesium transporter
MRVQIRDLRLLDAQPASSPPAILCREQAIVVNLEFIKCIITTRASPAPLIN